MKLRGMLFATTAMAVIGSAGNVHAEDASPAKQDVTSVDEVVVTAERRETTVQKTPIALAAFTKDQVESRGLTNVASLTAATPGLRFYDAIGQGFVSIRGVGAERNTTVGGDPSVAFNVDGVYIARNNGPASVFYDVQRIEVLRGPQGTLYGRNATGGVINIINNAPVLDDFGGDLDLTVGSFSRTRARGALNIPLVEGKVALRVSGLYERHDGYTENVRPAGGSDVNDQDDRAGRVQLLIQPTQDFSTTFRVSYTDRGGHGPQDKFLGTFAPVITGPYASPPNPSDPYKTVTDLTQHLTDRTTAASNTTDWDFSTSAFGDVRLSAVLGYVKEDFNFFLDPDSTGAAVANNVITADNKQSSAELRLASRGASNLTWVIGGYYLKEDNFGSTQFNAFAPGGAFLQSQTASLGISAKSTAIFGQATYTASDTFRLTLGLRYSEDKKTGDQRIHVLPANINLTDISSRQWSATTGKLSADYDLAPGHLVYATVSRGYKAGGYGLNQAPYNPEFVWAYEIGTKNRFFDGALVLNGTLFRYEQTDKQIAYTGLGLLGQPTLIIQNVASGRVWGAELEWQTRPTRELQFDGSVSYLDATYKTYASTDPSNPGAGVQNLSGGRQTFSPKWSLNFGAEYHFDLGSMGSLTPRLEYSWIDKMLLRPFGRPADIEPSAERINVRLAWRSSDNKYVLEGFVENATDKASRLSVLYSGLTGGFQSPYAPPRTYGVRLGVHF